MCIRKKHWIGKVKPPENPFGSAWLQWYQGVAIFDVLCLLWTDRQSPEGGAKVNGGEYVERVRLYIQQLNPDLINVDIREHLRVPDNN